MNIDYFYHTPAKKWNIIDAITYYDSHSSFSSSFQLFTEIKRDLTIVGQTQASLKKHLTAHVDDINVSLFLF